MGVAQLFWKIETTAKEPEQGITTRGRETRDA
jgi:hypothetical protein